MAHCTLGMLNGNITHLQLSDFRVVFVLYLVKSENAAAPPGSVLLVMCDPPGFEVRHTGAELPLCAAKGREGKGRQGKGGQGNC